MSTPEAETVAGVENPASAPAGGTSGSKRSLTLGHTGWRPLTFWLDLENLPCVTFFAPIIRRLRQEGHRVQITYRRRPEMTELLPVYSLAGRGMGNSGGKHLVLKIQTGIVRAARLSLWARRKEIDLAIGFGARPLALCCGLLGIPNATVIDYEHVSLSALRRFCDWIFVPQDVELGFWALKDVPPEKLVRFQGLKEDVYAYGHRFDTLLRSRLGIAPDRIVALIRPPAYLAHYHDGGSEVILRHILERIAPNSRVLALIVSRGLAQRERTLSLGPNVRVLSLAVNGLDLVGMADLVISGGGTMVREAAAIGVPAYSIFTGPLGSVDARLARERRLVLVRDSSLADQIAFRRKEREACHIVGDSSTLEFFVDRFVRLAKVRLRG